MKFAHLADAHIGSWRDPKLSDASLIAFLKAMDLCVSKAVDFILISGDLFNTSLPSIDRLKEVVKKLKQVKESNIEVYIVPGSHDFSPSGKTMLDVLEYAGLVKNVVKGEVRDDKLYLKFTTDQKTGVKITGMLGKRGMLEKSFYETLDLESLEQKQGFKIFMFHTALTELKPKDLAEMDSAPLSFLPKGFDYYAGGHIHQVIEKRETDYGLITYPGALFPNSFKEIEQFNPGGFYIYEEGKVEYCPVPVFDVVSINLNCNQKSPQEIRTMILQEINRLLPDDNTNVKDYSKTIVTLRLHGVLSEGKVTNIGFSDVFERIYEKGVYFIMKNTLRLTTKDFEEIMIAADKSHDFESSLIKEHLGKAKLELNLEKKYKFDDPEFLKEFMMVLDIEKQEGERNIDFEQRLESNFDKFLEI